MRLWKNVIKDANPKGCWHFKLKANDRGYPFLKRNGKDERVSRLMWEIHHGQIPATLEIRHTCDNPKCINPEHLLTGTTQDNADDRVRRKRSAVGEAHGQSELTVLEVKQIKALKGTTTLEKVAVQFKKSINTIWCIWNGKTWKDITVDAPIKSA